MVIRELLIRLGLTGSDSVGRGLDRVDGKVDKTIQSFNALGGVLATVFGAVTISNIAKTADEMQSLEARIGMLPQTITTGAEAFDTVAQRASAARQGIEEYASFYIKAGNATQDFYKDQEQVLQLTDAVSIALAASGSTAVAQGQAFFQLGQAIGSPTVQMEEMNTLIDVAPDLFRALGKAIPGANNNLKAFISTGKVTGKMLAEGLIKVLPQFVDQFKQMPMTIGQALVLVNNRWSMFINRLNRSSGAVTWVANKFLWMADKVEYSLDIVTDALGGAENAVRLLGVVLGSAGVIAGVWALNAAFTALVSPVMLAVGAVSLLYLAYDDFIAWSEGRPSIMEDIFGDYNDYKGGIEKFINALKWVKDAVGGWQTIFESFAAYLAGKWLTRVLATLGIATRAAASTGAAIATAGNSGGSVGILNKALAASFLYPIVEGAADNLIGDTSFGKWAKSTTLNDLFGSRAADTATSMDLTSLAPQRTYLGNSIGGVGGIPSIDYKPNINLTVNAATDNPQDIADAVQIAVGDQARDFLSGLGNTLNFNTGG
ncbi:tape measure protein [Enterobacter sp. 04-C-12-SI-ECC]|uniref:tape measure protein n=1 Tax=Enterobacter sp. 04-C-12-SI-ECC TaxID=3397243 RepID=UPI0039E044BB